ncbi:hypothetical protein [Providencia stuartii]|uniref:hypothetical protein n=1 Tax=Providencia stuartii TaxID=588 RepID=UPI0013D7DA8A|nr:hypothetical protein [Providencia stuartii]
MLLLADRTLASLAASASQSLFAAQQHPYWLFSAEFVLLQTLALVSLIFLVAAAEFSDFLHTVSPANLALFYSFLTVIVPLLAQPQKL